MSIEPEEIVSVTEIRFNLAHHLRKLTSGEVRKLVLLRNNRPVGVILTDSDYDVLTEKVEDLEETETEAKDIIRSLLNAAPTVGPTINERARRFLMSP